MAHLDDPLAGEARGGTALKSVVPTLGHPLEGVPESLVVHGTRSDFAKFRNNSEHDKPDSLPTPKDFDQLSTLGKISRVASVPSAIVAATLNPKSSPRITELLSLDTTFTWSTALRHRGWSRRDAAIPGLTLDMGLDPLWITSFGPLTKLGVVAKHFSVSERIGKILPKTLRGTEFLDNSPNFVKNLIRGFKIEKGSEMGQKVLAYQSRALDLHYGMTKYDHAAKFQRTAIGLNIPFLSSKGAIPIVPRQVSMLVFGIPRVMRKAFLAGARKVRVPGSPEKTLEDLMLASFMKETDPIIKEVSYLFRGILKHREAKVYKEVVEKFNKELQQLDSVAIDDLTRVWEDKKHFNLADSQMTADDFLKAGMTPEVANNKTVQKFMLKMKDDLKSIINLEKEIAGLTISQLEDPMNYILHLLTDEGLSKLKKAKLFAQLPELWGKGHGSQIQRRLRDKTIVQWNKLGKEGKIPGLEGIKFDKLFETNPVMLLYTRMLRGIRSITGAQYARTAGEIIGKKIPAGVPAAMKGQEIKALAQLAKMRKSRKRARRNVTLLRAEVANLERVARQAGAKVDPRTLRTRKAKLQSEEAALDSADTLVKNLEKDIKPLMAEIDGIKLKRSKAVKELEDAGQGFASKSPFLSDYRFPTRELRDEVDNVFGKVDTVESMSDWWKYYDATLSTWKGITLAPFPAYHFRNWVDNIWRNYLAGMPSVYYLHARRGLGHFHRDPKEFAAMSKLQIFGTPNPKGEVFTFENLLEEFTGIGMAEMGIRHQDTLVKAAPGTVRSLKGQFQNILNPLSNERPITGKIFDWARSLYENPARFAHYMWRRQMGDSALEAKISVQKFLFDYEEMDRDVRRVLGRVFPFISWMRFNVPFQIGQVLFNSRKLVPLTHIKNSDFIPSLLSKDDRDLEAKFLKDWQREGSPLFLDRDPKNPDIVRYMMLDGWISTLDLIRLFDPERYFIGMLSPLLREPFQQITNTDFTFRRPITTYTGIADLNLETDDFLNMPIDRRLSHFLRNIRAFNEVDRVLKLTADKDTPIDKWKIAVQRVFLGGGFMEVSEQRAITNLKFRLQRISADGRKAYLRAIRRGRFEEAWGLQQETYAKMIRGF